ncbi:XRE family transcriptional regulator [Mesorhizobium sp. J428]|uniref:XRE family transcriptional regulator n=1 Tax=Mesorhizobium sp. J428 TaxID=2898440 RepID=UPI0021516DBC|nr:XRE family transcriptional regulator [Mesorhizobium sp. J428]MCR5857966.1 XRE family transcriptional regulator [Mesorhizobium sp. J428]
MMHTRKPFAGTQLTHFLEKRILELRPTKIQAEIAFEAGFQNANMLAMLKNGTSRLPIDRVPALAKALDVDPRRLLQLALTQRGGDTTEMAIREVLRVVVSSHEEDWIDELRSASGNSDPALTSRARSALRGIFGK